MTVYQWLGWVDVVWDEGPLSGREAQISTVTDVSDVLQLVLSGDCVTALLLHWNNRKKLFNTGYSSPKKNLDWKQHTTEWAIAMILRKKNLIFFCVCDSVLPKANGTH